MMEGNQPVTEMKLWPLLFGLFGSLPLACPAWAALPADVGTEAETAGCRAGLAVVVGSSDGVAEAALAAGGRRLVQGLARDEIALAVARATIRAHGVYGLATVIRPLSLATLPYADGLVDLIVVDADALGTTAPSEAEVLRVVAPGGLVLTRRDGTWSRRLKLRPTELDDWTHFDHDASGSGQSHDGRIGPPTQVQWRIEVQPYRGWGGNPAAYRPYSTFRVAGGRSFCIEDQSAARAAAPKSKPENLVLQARLVANGLPLWKQPLPATLAGSTHLEYHLVADTERVVWMPEPGQPPVALEATTGRELFAYEVPPRELPAGVKSLSAAYAQLRLDQRQLVVSVAGTLHACDARTGKRNWSWKPTAGWAVFPRILRGGRVIAQIVAVAEGAPIEMRWPNLPTTAIVCVGLDDGQERWRVALPSGEQIPLRPDTPRERKAAPLSTGPMRIGQSLLAGDALFLFGASGIGASKLTGQIACVDTQTAQLKWVNWTGTWGYNLVARDDRPYWFTPSTLFIVDPNDGTVSSFWTAGFNNRCNRSAATDEWLINGMGIWVDKQGQAVVRSIARSGCAQGPTVAQGLVLYTPNTCSCITQLRGHLALSAETVRPAPDEAVRLHQDGGTVTTVACQPTALAGPIAAEWPIQFFAGQRETAPVNDDAGKTYVAVIHEHRLECRQGSQTLWVFTAGGRISHAPVRHGNAVLFGSHDGWAYCLNASTGALRWRFYAGGAERQIVSHGQVESSWPVYNVVLHDSLACFAAGLHPETGGGIYAWGLDPSTGQVRWRHRLVRTEVKLAPDKGKIAPNRVLNCPLTVDANGRLAIIGLHFSPAEDPLAIQQRIDTASFGDAARNDGGWTLRGEVPGPR